MAYIYKITNNVNSKVYIGKTERSLEERFKEHKNNLYKADCDKRPLYRAMKKYGIENFSISLVEKCSNDTVNEREIYWIKYYNSYHNGYNATYGGEGKLIFDREKIKSALLNNPYPIDIARQFNCSVSLVYDIAHTYHIPILNKGQKIFQENQKTIYQYDKNFNLINIFNSTTEAGKWCFDNGKCLTLNSGVRSHIAECANNKRKSAYGYIWTYKQK